MRASYACLSEKLSDGSMNCVAANGTFESRSLLCIVHDLFVFNLNVVGHYLKQIYESGWHVALGHFDRDFQIGG